MGSAAPTGGAWTTTLACVFLLAAAASVAHLLLPRRDAAATYLTSREADFVHLYMNAAMALMYAPFYDDRAARGLLAVFALAAAALAVRLINAVRRRETTPARFARGRIAGRAYHLLGTAAMFYAVWMTPMMHRAPGAAPAVPAILLAALFGLDAFLTGATPVFFPHAWSRIILETLGADPNAAEAASLNGRRDPRSLALVIAPHVLMDLGMAAMLVGWPPM